MSTYLPVNTCPQQLEMAARIYEAAMVDALRSQEEHYPDYEIVYTEGVPMFFPEYKRATATIAFAIAASREFYQSRGYRELAPE